jgi:hypothetical protein
MSRRTQTAQGLLNAFPGLIQPYPLMVDLDVCDKDLLLVVQVHDDLLAPVLGYVLHLVTPILDKHRKKVNFYRFPKSVLRYLYKTYV